LIECPRRQTLLSLLLCVRVAWPWQAHRPSQGAHAFPRYIHLAHVSPLVPVRTASPSNPTSGTQHDEGRVTPRPTCTKFRGHTCQPAACQQRCGLREGEGGQSPVPSRETSLSSPAVLPFVEIESVHTCHGQVELESPVHFLLVARSLRSPGHSQTRTGQKDRGQVHAANRMPQASTLADLWPYHT
jgi:hypothetical protein